MTYHFNRESDDDLIVVRLKIDSMYNFKMMLDTGASHTTIDRNALYMVNYKFGDKRGMAAIETSNGIIEVDKFEVGSLEALGMRRNNFAIQVYDFLAHGILSDYNGVLGLDFFDHTELHINFDQNFITIIASLMP